MRGDIFIMINYYFYIAPPSLTSSTPCSLLLPPGGPVVSLALQWSFTSQHAVERYHVVVTPDPSSCSSQHVSPSENFWTGPGDRLYSFTVSDINCGNQGDLHYTTTRYNTIASWPILGAKRAHSLFIFISLRFMYT